MKIVKSKNRVRIDNLPSGSLFMDENCVAIKSEYMTEKGLPECYIVDSGEIYWGGETDPEAVGRILVHRLKLTV